MREGVPLGTTSRSGGSPMTSEHQPYVLSMRKGEEIAIRVPGNPVLKHNGIATTRTLMLTEDQLKNVVRMLRNHNIRVEVRGPGGPEDDEQAELKAKMAEVQMKEATEWPTAQCPTCPWFDPIFNDKNPCGYDTWPAESRDTFYEQDFARHAIRDCPIKGNHDA